VILCLSSAPSPSPDGLAAVSTRGSGLEFIFFRFLVVRLLFPRSVLKAVYIYGLVYSRFRGHSGATMTSLPFSSFQIRCTRDLYRYAVRDYVSKVRDGQVVACDV
jgi:hypothetical protein